VLLLIAAVSWAGVRTRVRPNPANDSQAIQPAASAGLRVHVDPRTGRIVPPPKNAAPDPVAKEMFKSSHEGLVEERGTTAAGGFKVDARGRFRSAVTVSIGPDGRPVMNCLDTNEVQSIAR
jgi:hypothetical protein